MYLRKDNSTPDSGCIISGEETRVKSNKIRSIDDSLEVVTENRREEDR